MIFVVRTTSYARHDRRRTTSIVNKAYRGDDRGRTICVAAALRQTLVNRPPGAELCEIFRFCSFQQSKSVNIVCKLLQLSGKSPDPYWGFAPGPHWKPPEIIAPNENSWRRECVCKLIPRVVLFFDDFL